MSRVVGKKALSESIFKFAQSQNVVVSGAFCDRLADHVKDHIASALLSDGRFGLNGLGSLNVVQRKARTAVNPRTQEQLQVPAKKTVTFRVAPDFKQALNKH